MELLLTDQALLHLLANLEREVPGLPGLPAEESPLLSICDVLQNLLAAYHLLWNDNHVLRIEAFLERKCSRDFMLACLLLCLPYSIDFLSIALCSNLHQQDLTPSAIRLLVLLVLHELLCLQTALKVNLGAFQQNKLFLPRASIFGSSYRLMLLGHWRYKQGAQSDSIITHRNANLHDLLHLWCLLFRYTRFTWIAKLVLTISEILYAACDRWMCPLL